MTEFHMPTWDIALFNLWNIHHYCSYCTGWPKKV